MRTPDDVARFIAGHSIRAEIIFLDLPTPTVEAAALAVGTTPEQIVKSVVFSVQDRWVLAIASGTRLIERRCIAAHFGVGRKRIRLASAPQVLAATGFPAGTVPPFGHAQPLPTLIDYRVLALTEAYAGGGAHNALMRVNPQDILQITGAEVMNLHNWPSEP